MKPENKPGREVTHWKAKPFLLLVAGFFVFMVLTYVGVAGLTASWFHGTWPGTAPVAPAQTVDGWNETAPQLQTNAERDLQRYQKKEYERLHTTGWADPTHSYATIPIEQAMDLVAKADADHRLNDLLPPPRPATPIELQNQKATEAPKSP